MSNQVNGSGAPNPYTNGSGPQPAQMMAQSPAASPAGTIGAPDDYSGLVTPDSLMAYCEARLGSLDSQMQAIFQQQTAGTNFMKEVDNAVAAFNVYSGGINSGAGSIAVPNSPDGTQLKDLNTTLTTLQSEVPPGSDAGSAIQDAITILNQGNDNVVHPDEVANIVKDLQGISTDQNSSLQLQMINLQSLMSQQQTAVQLTTNMMQALDQQAQAVATNIGK